MNIEINSIVSNKDYSPYVQMKWGAESGQLTPEEARQHAYGILEAAEAAESDAMMVSFLREKIGIKENVDIGLVLKDFREFRERKSVKEGQNKTKI